MAFYVEQVHSGFTGQDQLPQIGGTTYTLTSAADGTELTDTGSVLIVSSDADGWFYVSTTVATDKAASTKKHRLQTGQVRSFVGARKGYFISWLADA